MRLKLDCKRYILEENATEILRLMIRSNSSKWSRPSDIFPSIIFSSPSSKKATRGLACGNLEIGLAFFDTAESVVKSTATTGLLPINESTSNIFINPNDRDLYISGSMRPVAKGDDNFQLRRI
ncbi:hypothetical protein Fot_40537 [Forsythia ovata]|uniref:Uncharacterized protein n=1 Tax=Forsythia ovata TaxID=205694 RepID=A0ABD1S7T0_9LAMI